MLYLIPTPVGNLEDITMRALRLLREVDVILAEDTRTTGLLLKHYNITGHLMSHHKFNEHQTAEALAKRMAAGETMALVSDAGTPGISDPGFLLVRAAITQGVEVQCLPGATAFVPALVASGLPSERFSFEGFLPPKKGRQSKLETLQTEERTMIFYESPHRVCKTLEQMQEFFGADRPCAACREISKLHEQTIRGSIAQVLAHFLEHDPRGEFVLIVGGNNTKASAEPPPQKTKTPRAVDPITGVPIDALSPPANKAALRKSKRHR